MKTRLFVVVNFPLLLLAASLRAGPSEADVGDPDSFHHNMLYMGAAGGTMTLQANCSGNTPPNQCFPLNPQPNDTPFNVVSVCQINLPNGSTKDIIYPVVTFIHGYTLRNNTGSATSGEFTYNASITIDSDALNNPGCIDPSTSAPCAGHLVMQFNNNIFIDKRTISAGDSTEAHLNYTHAGNLSIMKRKLVEAGIPQNIADKLFQGAMTIHLTISGDAILCTDGLLVGNLRLFGD